MKRRFWLWLVMMANPVPGVSQANGAGAAKLRDIQVSVRSLLLRQAGDTMPLGIMTTYDDGSFREVTKGTVYSSSDPRIAEVTPAGQVRAVGNGTCVISVSYGKLMRTVTVTVGLDRLKGDLNGDGVIDHTDLEFVLKALNTPVNGPNDPRDLNPDGRIDAADARILMTLCARERCAVKGER